MKIGITCYPTYGGSGVVATELGKTLAQRGHEVHFIAYSVPFRLDGDDLDVSFHEVEVTTYPLFKYPPYDLALACKMLEVTESHRLDLLHVHYAIPHSISAFLAREMLPERGVRVVTTLHGTDITVVGNDRSYHPVTRFGIDRSDGVTAVSDYLRVETQRIFGTSRPISVIPNFVDVRRFRPDPEACLRPRLAPDGEVVLLHLSNFRRVKRIPVVIRTFAAVAEKVDAKLVLVGDGPERRPAEMLARRLGVPDRVHFLGKQDRVERFFQAADLFLLPSEFESFGLSALEAMACGVPVIGAHGGGLPEVVTDGENGFLCEPGSADAMSARALEYLGSRTMREEIPARCRARAVEHFEENAVARRYEELYEEVLEAEPCRG